jgi:hypothetical protein
VFDDVLGVRLAHLCCNESGLDANILQEVVNGTNHLGVSKKEHVHDGRARRSAFRIEEVERLMPEFGVEAV